MFHIDINGNWDKITRFEDDTIKRLRRGAQRPLRRTLNETKKTIRKEVKARYTYKGAIRMQTYVSTWNGRITISSTRNKPDRFNLRRPKPFPVRGKYLTVHFLRSKGTVFKEGFFWSGKGTYFERISSPRFPVHSIKGPSTAEMAGHEPMPATAIEAALYRNIERFMGQYFGDVM